MTQTKTTAVYVRVSSTSQNTASQLDDLKAWAAQQKGQVKFYTDKCTGTVMDRPAFNKMLDAARQGELHTICVWRLDRLGRTAAGLTALFEELQALKVNLVSLKDGLDLKTPAGRLMSNVLASVAAFETEVRHERQAAGIAAAKAKGKTWGGREKGERWKVTPDQVEVARVMKKSGKPITAIAKTLNLSRPTVYTILKG